MKVKKLLKQIPLGENVTIYCNDITNYDCIESFLSLLRYHSIIERKIELVTVEYHAMVERYTVTIYTED